MDDKKLFWKAAEIRERGRAFTQRLNPTSLFLGVPLSRLAGLRRANVSLARIPAGKDSFAYHAHLLEEEWVFVVAGEGVAVIGDEEHALGPGDFIGFPAGSSPPHLLKNRSSQDLVYLMGGENQPLDIVEYPLLGKRYLLQASPIGTIFHELGAQSTPFGAAPDETDSQE